MLRRREKDGEGKDKMSELGNNDLVEILASLGLLTGMMETVLDSLNSKIGTDKIALERAVSLVLLPSTSSLKIKPGWPYLGQVLEVRVKSLKQLTHVEATGAGSDELFFS